MNQSPCVHISGQWKASSTRYRPPWWPLGGWASPKVLNWKTTTLLTQNYIWIISSVDQQYHVISRAHKHMPKCQQKNCSTGAIKSLNPLTMISTFYLGWTHLPLVSSVTGSAVSEKSPFHTDSTLSLQRRPIFTLLVHSQGSPRGMTVHIMTLTSMCFFVFFFNLFPHDLSKHVSSHCL